MSQVRLAWFAARLSAFIALAVTLGAATPVAAEGGSCPPFHLRAEDGSIINPLTGKNVDKPYSPKQTCGKCHNYKLITKGYHFQQGWSVVSDKYCKKNKVCSKPWVLSNGMMGKW